MRLKKGDNVIVIAGKDKGKKGKIAEVITALDRVVIDGLNMRKRHQKPRRSNQKGQTVSYAAPMHVSNVMFVDAKTNKGVRVEKKPKA